MNNPRCLLSMLMRSWLLMVLCPCLTYAQVLEEETEMLNDEEVRENPELERGDSVPQQPSDYAAYPFLNLDANRLELNGADWKRLRSRFAIASDTVVSIVHIGDSHIQAEGSTSPTRVRLQQYFGDAGRGLIIPFRLSGTNQPLDYRILSDSNFEVAKLMRHPWAVEMGFSGVALQPTDNLFDFRISVSESQGFVHAFNTVRIFVHGAMPMVMEVSDADGVPLFYTGFVSEHAITLVLDQEVTEVKLVLERIGQCQIYGFQLENGIPGVQYSAIGNNGATYSSYQGIRSFGSDLSMLTPDLVIISLGANEAFGKVSDEAFYHSIDALVREVRGSNANAQILLVTPAECQRSKRVARRRRRTKTYIVNDNVKRLRDVVLRYGKDQGVATYDWYAVAGGDGSSQHWLSHKLMGTDRIHNTWSGYALQGNLFYDALIKSILSVE